MPFTFIGFDEDEKEDGDTIWRDDDTGAHYCMIVKATHGTTSGMKAPFVVELDDAKMIDDDDDGGLRWPPRPDLVPHLLPLAQAMLLSHDGKSNLVSLDDYTANLNAHIKET